MPLHRVFVVLQYFGPYSDTSDFSIALATTCRGWAPGYRGYVAAHWLSVAVGVCHLKAFSVPQPVPACRPYTRSRVSQQYPVMA